MTDHNDAAWTTLLDNIWKGLEKGVGKDEARWLMDELNMRLCDEDEGAFTGIDVVFGSATSDEAEGE